MRAHTQTTTHTHTIIEQDEREGKRRNIRGGKREVAKAKRRGEREVCVRERYHFIPELCSGLVPMDFITHESWGISLVCFQKHQQGVCSFFHVLPQCPVDIRSLLHVCFCVSQWGLFNVLFFIVCCHVYQWQYIVRDVVPHDTGSNTIPSCF